MENNTDPNTLNFNNAEAKEKFIEAIENQSDIKNWISDFKKNNQTTHSGQNSYQIIGITLGKKGHISNKKMIYDLYRSIESNAEQIYPLDSWKGLLKLLGVTYANGKAILQIEDKQYELAEFFYRKKPKVGRHPGKTESKKTKKLVNDFSANKEWEEKEAFIQDQLSKYTFSIYYYTEYFEYLKDDFKKPTKRIREVRRRYLTFKDSNFSIGIMNLKTNKGDSFLGKYTITPVRKTKFVLKTIEFELPLEFPLEEKRQLTFFFELGTSLKLDELEFATGYYRESFLTHGFCIGLAVLVKEEDITHGEGTILNEDNIAHLKYQSYRELKDLPIPELRDFFAKREQNYLKPPTVHEKKFRNLQVEINLQKNKPKDLGMFEYDGFVSMPIIFDSPNQEVYNNRIATFNEIENKFKGKTLHYPPSKKELEQYKLDIKNHSFLENVEFITKSRYFILIIPKIDYNITPRVSKSFLEVGIALFLRRPILCLCHAESEQMIPENVIANSKDIILFSRVEDIEDTKIQDFFIRNPSDFF